MPYDSISPLSRRLADALRDHRKAYNLSLGELGARTGLSKTSVARLEAGEGNPSLETLWRLARELGLTIGQLLDHPEPEPARILRSHEGSIVRSTAGMRGRLLQTDERQHRTEIFELVLPPNSRFRGDAHDAGTLELVFCIEGAASCGPDDQLLQLEPGDTGYFDGSVPHVYASGPGGRVLLVMSYPLGSGAARWQATMRA